MDPKAVKLVELLWGTIVKRLDYFEISELIRKPWPLTYVIAKEGNLEFLSILIREHPALIFKNTIVASLVGKEKNTILHLAAMLPADQNRLNVVSGAARAPAAARVVVVQGSGKAYAATIC
ncbi:hypothetical protein JRO89_XSUnG0003300 [Xanthoceras sorbifolium]|uniref:Uncharacterized protein n=1 Tax=Xanthoceras sorbifolium TaxID=99658 RepID=A0ABQ8H0D6_9ROSI|nr:hypothetical protein JRO89_XSUnG0003300 [Xanthoceras sorbifolium]